MMAQTNERLEAKQFAVETLESLQKLCPMSMAVTLRHFAAVYHAVRTGVLAAALKAQLNIVFLHGFCAGSNTIRLRIRTDYFILAHCTGMARWQCYRISCS